jgi:hypothetical protein
LDISAVSNLTGYTVEEISLLVENKQIPNNSWPDGKVIFPTADIEKWIKTHRLQKPAAAPKAAAAWPDDTPPPLVPAKDEDPAGPPANPKEDARKAKRAAATAKARAAKGTRK